MGLSEGAWMPSTSRRRPAPPAAIFSASVALQLHRIVPVPLAHRLEPEARVLMPDHLQRLTEAQLPIQRDPPRGLPHLIHCHARTHHRFSLVPHRDRNLRFEVHHTAGILDRPEAHCTTTH